VLTSLDLSNNMVHTMHPECSTLVHLTELFLNNNELVMLPDSLASFTAVMVRSDPSPIALRSDNIFFTEELQILQLALELNPSPTTRT